MRYHKKKIDEMTSIIKLHAISGAMNESPPCYILQVDELRILLDCGWDENFDQDFIKELKRYIYEITVTLTRYTFIFIYFTYFPVSCF